MRDIPDILLSRPHSDILADVVGRPDGRLPVAELVRLNPGWDRTELSDALDDLVADGIIQIDESSIRLSERGRLAVEESQYYPRDALRGLYESVSE